MTNPTGLSGKAALALVVAAIAISGCASVRRPMTTWDTVLPYPHGKTMNVPCGAFSSAESTCVVASVCSGLSVPANIVLMGSPSCVRTSDGIPQRCTP